MGLVERRIGLLFAVFLVLIGAAAARAAYLGSVKAPSLQRAADGQQVSDVVVPAKRGSITDRNGIELAVSEPAMSVAATPYLVRDPVAVARRVAPLIGRDEAGVLEDLARRDTGFVYLARQVPATRARKVQEMRIEGLQFVSESRRVYPRGWLASQVIGTAGLDNTGLSGIEYSLDARVGGRAGRRRYVRDPQGNAVRVREVSRAEEGSPVALTIDAAVQDKVEDVLAEVGQTFRPKGATAVVMDPRTSEILALANWPRVDANDVGGSPPYARQNRAVGFTYEPGSTFKAFTVAGALEDGVIEPGTEFDLAPKIQVADREIGESHPRPWVRLNVAQILAQSSNVGAVRIGLRMRKVAFDRWVRAFGFGRTTGVDLPGEERGIVPRLEQYSGSSMGNLPIGQGLSVTPIQMAAAYAAIANGGVLRAPRIVRAIGGRAVPHGRGRRVISRSTAATVREMLEGVIGPGGTAPEATIPGYQLAGKTGTANKPDPKTGEYSKYKIVASFAGFAPARNPRLLVTVMVDEPQGETAGGIVAAPAFQKITSFALGYLRIPPA